MQSTMMLAALLTLTSLVAAAAGAETSGIHVSGKGEIRTVPDMARVNLETRREGTDAAALKTELDDVTRAVLRLTREMGIEARLVTAAAVSIRPRYRHRNGETELDGLTATRTVEVILEDLGDVTRLINGALERGVNGVGGIQLDLSNRDELERQALDLAVDDARDEAQRVARRFGVALGPVLDVYVDRHEVRPVMMEAMAMKAADSAPDFSPGEITVQRNIQATFGVGEPAGS
jgi:uncharacterized protein YggE